MKPYRWLALWITIFSILASAIGVAHPYLYKLFFDILSGESIPFYQSQDLSLLIIIVMIGVLGILGNVSYRIGGFFNTRFQPMMIRDIERYGFSYILDHSYRFFTNNFTGSLVRKVRRLSRSFEKLADQFHWKFLHIFTKLLGVFLVLYFQYELIAYVLLAWIIVFILVNIIISRWKLRYDEQRAEADSHVTATLADAVTNNPRSNYLEVNGMR